MKIHTDCCVMGIGLVPTSLGFEEAPVEDNAERILPVRQQSGIDLRGFGGGVARGDQVGDAHSLVSEVLIKQLDLPRLRPFALVGRQVLVERAPHGDLSGDQVVLQDLLARMGRVADQHQGTEAPDQLESLWEDSVAARRVEDHVRQAAFGVLLHEGEGAGGVPRKGLGGTVGSSDVQPAPDRVDGQDLFSPHHPQVLRQQLPQGSEPDHRCLHSHVHLGAAHPRLRDRGQLREGGLLVADFGGDLDQGWFHRDVLPVVGIAEDPVPHLEALHLHANLLNPGDVAVTWVEGVAHPVRPVGPLVHLPAVADALGAGAD